MSQGSSSERQQDQAQTVGNISVDGEGNNVNITFTQTEIIQISIDEIKTRSFVSISPYKGLKKFELEDKDRFFGRDQLVFGLLNELEQNGLILLLGASGSGKSSVVRAGLISWLISKWGGKFINLTFTPDEDPFESLYASLLGKYKQSESKIARESDVKTLTHVVKTLKQKDEQWLIFIDQFEELFTISLDEKRKKFIDSLVQLIQLDDKSIRVVMTMRADFLEKLSHYPNLGKILQKHIRLMTDMQPDELWLAIEQPAAKHGVVFEKGLVEEIRKDIEGEAGYLPLLQYTLNLLWENETLSGSIQDRTLNTRTYRELGGVRGALQKRVDRIYEQLPETKKAATKQIFLRLVDIDRDVNSGAFGKAVSRRAYLTEFTGSLVEDTLKELIDQNLLVSNDANRNQQPTIEIAHEALLSSWESLKEWIKDAQEAITFKNRLNEDATHWRQTKSNDELWSGSKLEKVLELRKDNTFQVLGGLSEAEDKFIDNSLSYRDRRRQRTILGLTGFSAIAIILAGMAAWQWQQAEQQRKLAESVQESQVNSLSSYSESLYGLNQKWQSLLEILKATQAINSQRTKPETILRASIALLQAVSHVEEFNQLEGHGDFVYSVRFSPDRKIIVSASLDNTVKIWELNGKSIETLTGHNGYVFDASFSPDGKTIATVSADKTVKLWNLNNLKEAPKTLSGHGEAVYSVSFSPDGKTIATASADKTVKLWNLNNLKEAPKTFTGHGEAVYSVSFSPDGKTVATASADKTVKLWNLNNLKETPKTLTGHGEAVYSVSFSLDGKTIATASADKTVKLWNLNNLKETPKTLTGHGDKVRNVSFSPDGKTIVSASDDKNIKLWNIDGQELQTLTGHKGKVYSASFSRDGRTIASGSADNKIKLWHLRENQTRSLRRHGDVVTSVSFSSDGKIFATASSDKTIKIWNLSGQEIKTYKGHTGSVNSVSVSPNKEMIVSASDDKTVKLWYFNGQEPKTFAEHKDRVNTVSFSSDGKTIASGSADGVLNLWDLDGKSKTIQGHEGSVFSVKFSPDGKIVASGGNDGILKLWEVNERELKIIKSLKGHEGSLVSIEFSPDGKTIATSGIDNTIRLWGIDGQSLKTMKGHTDRVMSVSFSPDGQIIASASADKTIKFWSLNGQELSTIKAHSDEINSVSFSPNSKRLVLISGSKDKTIAIWNLDLAELQLAACDWIKDYLVNHSEQSTEFSICQKNLSAKDQSILIFNQAEALAKQGNIDAALVKFQESLQLHPELEFNPKALSSQLFSSALLYQGEILAKQSSPKLAFDNYLKAEKIDPTLEISASAWSSLCFSGVINQQVAGVMSACDKAVMLSPKEGIWRSNRGVARAKSGNVVGAIEDFQSFVEWTKSKSALDNGVPEDLIKARQRRQKWISDLRSGRDPFTAEEIKFLGEETL